MSIHISIHTIAADPDAALARWQQPSITPGLVFVSARRTKRPHFHVELYGLDPNISVFFGLDTERLDQARAAVGNVIRSFLETSDDDMVAVYVDFAIVKRIGDVRLCDERFRDFVPADQSWSFVPEIPELE